MADHRLTTLCPHCSSPNRFQVASGKDAPHCQQCGKRLFPDCAVAVDDERLKRHLKTEQLPILVDFWAPGCRPCKMMMPVLDQLAKKKQSQLRILKLNTAEYSGPIKKYALRAVPTLIVFRKGKVLDRVSGGLDYPRLERWLKSII